MFLQRHYVLVTLALFWLEASACASRPEVDVTLHESDRGKVNLERISDRSFQAAHPIKLPTETVARILRGIRVKGDQGFLKNLVGSNPGPARVFSEDDIAFLVPLLVDGLSRAAPDQEVGFTINQIGPPVYSQNVGAAVGSSEPPLRMAPTEVTGGSIYAYGRSLYVTITQFRYREERADTINMANRRLPDQTGLVNHQVLFVPEAAKRPDSYRDSRSIDSTIVIDYELLARLPADTGTGLPNQAASPSPVTQPPVSNEKPTQKDPELEALRKELDDIKRQLAEQETQRSATQPSKKTIPPKSP